MRAEHTTITGQCEPGSNSNERMTAPYYLPIGGGRIVGCIDLPRVFVLHEMHSFIQVWTQFTMTISNNNNHYATDTSQEYYCNVKCKQLRLRFELSLLCPFPMAVTITPHAPPL